MVVRSIDDFLKDTRREISKEKKLRSHSYVDLALSLAADAIERIDILMLEIRHFQSNLAYVLNMPELNRVLRYEEEFLWCGVERLQRDGNAGAPQFHSWDSLFEDSRVRPALFNEFAELWAPILPKLHRDGEIPADGKEGEQAQPAFAEYYEDVVVETVSPFWRQKVIHPLTDRIRHCRDTGRVDEAFAAEYLCFDALQTLKRNILQDKLHLCWWIKKAFDGRDFNAAKFKAYDKSPDPLARREFGDDMARLSEMLIVRAGAIHNLHYAIKQLEDLKGQFDRILDVESQDRLRPFMVRRREQGLYNDVLLQRSKNIFHDIDRMMRELCPDAEWHGKHGDVMHFSAQTEGAYNQSMLDATKSARAARHPDETTGRPVYAYHLLRSSYLMPDRPDLQPLIGHECAHCVLRARLDEITRYGRVWPDNSINKLIRDLVKVAENYYQSNNGNVSHDPLSNTRYMVRELLCDIVASSVFGPSYLFALLLELTGHLFHEILMTPQMDAETDLSLATYRFSESGFGNARLNASWYIRTMVMCDWIEYVAKRSEKNDAMSGRLISGARFLASGLFQYVEDRRKVFDAGWGEYHRNLATDFSAVIRHSDFVNHVKEWRESEEAADKRRLGEDDGVPLHDNRNTEMLRSDVRGFLSEHLILAKALRKRREADPSGTAHGADLLGLGEDADETAVKTAISEFYTNYYPGIPKEKYLSKHAKTIGETIEFSGKAGPHFRYLYDIPWQSTMMRVRDFDMTMRSPVNERLLLKLSNDFAPGRETYSTALEFTSYESKRPSQRLTAVVRRLANLFTSSCEPDEPAEFADDALPSDLRRRDRVLDYVYVIRAAARADLGVNGDSAYETAAAGDHSILGLGAKIIGWLLGEGFERSYIELVNAKTAENLSTRVEKEYAVNEILMSLLGADGLRAREFFTARADALRSSINDIGAWVERRSRKSAFSANDVHCKACKHDAVFKTAGALTFFAVSPLSGPRSADEPFWRDHLRVCDAHLGIYEVACRAKLGDLAERLKLHNLHDHPSFCSLYRHTEGFFVRQKGDESASEESKHVARAVKAISENPSQKVLEERVQGFRSIHVRKISRLSIAESVKFWSEAELPESDDGKERFARARYSCDISWRPNETITSRLFPVLGKFDMINVANAKPVWRWRLPIQDRQDISKASIIADVERDFERLRDVLLIEKEHGAANERKVINRRLIRKMGLDATERSSEWTAGVEEETNFRVAQAQLKGVDNQPRRRGGYLWEGQIFPYIERRELGLRCSLKGKPLNLVSPDRLDEKPLTTKDPDADVLAFISVQLHRRQSRLEFLSRLKRILEDADLSIATVSSTDSVLPTYALEDIGALFEEGDHAYLTEGWGDLMIALVERPGSISQAAPWLYRTPNRLGNIYLIQQALFNDWMVSRTELNLRPSCLARALADFRKSDAIPPSAKQAFPANASPTFQLRQDLRFRSDRSRTPATSALIGSLLQRARAFHIGGVVYETCLAYFNRSDVRQYIRISDLRFAAAGAASANTSEECLHGYEQFLSSLSEPQDRVYDAEQTLKVLFSPAVGVSLRDGAAITGRNVIEELKSHLADQLAGAFSIRRNAVWRNHPGADDLLDFFLSVQQSPGRSDAVLQFIRARSERGSVDCDLSLALKAWIQWTQLETCNGASTKAPFAPEPEDTFSYAVRGLHWILPKRNSEDASTILAFDHTGSLIPAEND